MYHIEFITEDCWETAFASNRKTACLLADALQDACGDDIRVYSVEAAKSDNEAMAPIIITLDWRSFVKDGIYQDKLGTINTAPPHNSDEPPISHEALMESLRNQGK